MIQKIEELIRVGKLNEALKIINNSQKELFFSYPIDIINNHLYILIELEMYDECYKVLDIYKSFPYQSMEVEEHFVYLNDKLPEMIQNSIKQKNKESYIDENGVDFSKYRSNKNHDLLSFLVQIYKTQLIKDYELEINNILDRSTSDDVTFMCLCMLYELKSNKNVNFKYKNSSFSVVLEDIHFPYSNSDKEFYAIKKNLLSIKDVSIQNTSEELLKLLRLNIFPDHFKQDDIPYISEALINTAKKLYGKPIILLENERVKFFMNLLEEISKS